ncbi:MAG: hypothetical protein ACON4U_00380 [Myxococcota bacterium]
MLSTHRHWVHLFGLLSLFGCLWVHYVLLQGVPHVVDESSYLLQARVFASGHRTAGAWPLSEYFHLAYWNSAPISYSAFPFGWPLLLSIGELIGAPGLINPICAASLPYLTYALVKPLRGDREALIAAMVISISPGVWVLGGTMMSHTSCLVAALGLWVALRHDNPKLIWAVVCWGYWLWARPFEGVLFGLPLTLWAVRLNWASLLRLAPLYALVLGVQLWDNFVLTGHPTTFPVNVWFEAKAALGTVPEGCNALGFGENIGCIPTLGTMGHSMEKAIRIARDSLFRLDYLLLAFSGSFVLAVMGLWRWKQGWPYALALVWPVVAYMFYWSPGSLYGARFYHNLYLFLPLFLAAGLSVLPKHWPFVAVPMVVVFGGFQIAGDLGNGYRCVDGELVSNVRGLDLTGTVFIDIRHKYMEEWPAFWFEAQECTVVQMATGIAAENRPNLQIRQLPSDSSKLELAPQPHYVLRKWTSEPAELLRIE